MGGHHHHGGGGRGRGWGGGYPYPVIIEDNWDDPLLLIGAEKKLIAPLHLGPAAVNPAADPNAFANAWSQADPATLAKIAALATPVSSTPDAALVTATAPPVAVAAPLPVAAPKKSLIPAGGALAGGVAGFAVGGPIGAAIGAAVGYFGGKAVDNKTTVATQTVVTPPAKTPAVNGDCCWNNAAGWSPHGDERMR